MFLDNLYAEPLFSFNGGPAKAFRCKICSKITSTESGMRVHLKKIHEWEEQACLSSMDKQKDQSQGQPRKLRTQPIVFPSPEKQAEVNTDKKETISPPKSKETNEGELLRLMKEEK